MEVLHCDITEKENELEEAEFARSGASRKEEALEVGIQTLHFEQDNDLETARLKEERLDERIVELERDNSLLQNQVSALEDEKAQLLTHPSSSRTSSFPNVPP